MHFHPLGLCSHSYLGLNSPSLSFTTLNPLIPPASAQMSPPMRSLPEPPSSPQTEQELSLSSGFPRLCTSLCDPCLYLPAVTSAFPTHLPQDCSAWAWWKDEEGLLVVEMEFTETEILVGRIWIWVVRRPSAPLWASFSSPAQAETAWSLEILRVGVDYMGSVKWSWHQMCLLKGGGGEGI